jgi:hypothetical protein
MAQQPTNTSYPISEPPIGISTRHAHGFRQVLAAVAEAITAHPPAARRTSATDRLRSAATSPTSGWAELLLKRYRLARPRPLTPTPAATNSACAKPSPATEHFSPAP